MDQPEGHEELGDLLRELVRRPGVVAAALGLEGTQPLSRELFAGAAERRLPLAPGIELVVLQEREGEDVTSAVDRAARALRGCLRRLGLAAADVPELTVLGRAVRGRDGLVRRIAHFLDAYGAAHGASGAALLRGAELVAVGGTLSDAERERLPFLRKRLDAEAARTRGKSSHAEIVGDDFFACSFWFGAYLIAFFPRAFAVDFVRHKARAVTRELAVIMPHLDEDPPDPADIKPVPPSDP